MYLILGMQGGYTKYLCFPCLWDSRADDKNYMQNKRPSRKNTPAWLTQCSCWSIGQTASNIAATSSYKTCINGEFCQGH